MARIRSIKPEYWSDRKLAQKASRDARLLYISLWNMADEHGRVNGDARWIKGHCLPYDDDVSLAAVERLVGQLEACGRVQRYEVDGDPYLFLPKLADHQRLEPDKSASRLPAPPDPSLAQTIPSPAQIFPDESAQIDAQQVAGSRGQVAGIAPKNGATEVPGKTKTSRAPTRTDAVWDGMLDACGIDPGGVNDLNRGGYNVAAKALRDAGATAEEMRRRVSEHRKRWSGVSVTPQSLAKHWPELGRQARAAPSSPHVGDLRERVEPVVANPESVAATVAAVHENLKRKASA